MCGISGSIVKSRFDREDLIKKTLSLMKRRGPDNRSQFKLKYNDKVLNLLHTRLNIIDINKRSNQPMTIGEFTNFNGEIYNYIELRKLKLKNYSFETNSDTEVLLKSYIEYGENCVNHFNGMWAFAIWIIKKLFISRDIFGEKPLYYHLSDKGIFFGSEIKFIKSLSNESFKVNKEHINKNLFYGYKSLCKNNETFFDKIYSLENSTNITIDLNLNLIKRKFWSPKINIDNSLQEKTASYEVKRLVQKSLKLRMRSDVPIAFCLSGGIDSGLLVSLANKKFHKKVSTFSIIDQDYRYNERKNINLILDDLKCDNLNIFKKEKFILKRLKELTNYHDGPISTIFIIFTHFWVKKYLRKDTKLQYQEQVQMKFLQATTIIIYYICNQFINIKVLKNLENWYKFVLIFIRNPNLKDPYLYINDKKNRDNVFNQNLELKFFPINKKI